MSEEFVTLLRFILWEVLTSSCDEDVHLYVTREALEAVIVLGETINKSENIFGEVSQKW